MHTFKAQRNKIKWRVAVRGEIPWFPDIYEEFEFRVTPSQAPARSSLELDENCTFFDNGALKTHEPRFLVTGLTGLYSEKNTDEPKWTRMNPSPDIRG